MTEADIFNADVARATGSGQDTMSKLPCIYGLSAIALNGLFRGDQRNFTEVS